MKVLIYFICFFRSRVSHRGRSNPSRNNIHNGLKRFLIDSAIGIAKFCQNNKLTETLLLRGGSLYYFPKKSLHTDVSSELFLYIMKIKQEYNLNTFNGNIWDLGVGMRLRGGTSCIYTFSYTSLS